MPRITKTLTPPMRRLPARAKQLREEVGMSQREVERGGGLPGGWVSRIERGDRLDGLAADMLVRLARGIGCSVGDLLGEPPVIVEVPERGRARLGEPAPDPKRLPGRIRPSDAAKKS